MYLLRGDIASHKLASCCTICLDSQGYQGEGNKRLFSSSSSINTLFQHIFYEYELCHQFENVEIIKTKENKENEKTGPDDIQGTWMVKSMRVRDLRKLIEEREDCRQGKIYREQKILIFEISKQFHVPIDIVSHGLIGVFWRL